MYSHLNKKLKKLLSPSFLTPIGEDCDLNQRQVKGTQRLQWSFCWEEKGARLFSYSWFMLYCILLSLEIDCRNKVGPWWVLGKSHAGAEGRFRFKFPERKVQAACMQFSCGPAQLTQAGTGAGLGIKSEPKISIITMSFSSSVPLWETLKYYKVSFSQWTEILFIGIVSFF